MGRFTVVLFILRIIILYCCSILFFKIYYMFEKCTLRPVAFLHSSILVLYLFSCGALCIGLDVSEISMAIIYI